LEAIVIKVLLAGDHFVRPDVLAEALSRHLPEAETTVLQNDWPITPWTHDGGVREAQGDEDQLIEALQGIDVCFTHTQRLTRNVISACSDLKLITVCRGGPVNADVEAASDHSVLLSFTPSRNAIATTEHSVAMILSAVRQIPQRHFELVSGRWRGDLYQYDLVGPEVAGSHVGLVGYGAIGSRVAQVMVAMDAEVGVFDPYLGETELPPGVKQVSTLEDLMSTSNIVSIHARLTKDNENMIGAEQIALMPPDSILVNCARGGLLDYEAMCDALDSGHLYAAACDVLPLEPLPSDHRLLRTPRLTLTPHLAGASRQAARLAADIGASDIARYAAGERPVHLANPDVYGR
jgi:D-3-phosphoglycerate dehydrogenase